jgi:hypothetical protein
VRDSRRRHGIAGIMAAALGLQQPVPLSCWTKHSVEISRARPGFLLYDPQTMEKAS